MNESAPSAGPARDDEHGVANDLREINAGIEWQIAKWIELTTELMASERTVDGEAQEGRLVRLQLQFNYRPGRFIIPQGGG